MNCDTRVHTVFGWRTAAARREQVLGQERERERVQSPEIHEMSFTLKYKY